MRMILRHRGKEEFKSDWESTQLQVLRFNSTSEAWRKWLPQGRRQRPAQRGRGRGAGDVLQRLWADCRSVGGAGRVRGVRRRLIAGWAGILEPGEWEQENTHTHTLSGEQRTHRGGGKHKMNILEPPWLWLNPVGTMAKVGLSFLLMKVSIKVKIPLRVQAAAMLRVGGIL